MSNEVTSAGISTDTEAELVSFMTTQYQTIYGADINLDSDSPDGQMMRIFVQVVLDVLDLITQVYNSMDPDKAFGSVLDSRVSYNGIQRNAGTFTTTNITLTASQALNLVGLNDDEDNAYTISDNEGTEWQLVDSQSILTAGVYVYEFRAKEPGATLTTPNTITVPVTIVLGVTSVNNPSTYLTLGTNEETDAALKIRRQQSVTLSSQGYLAGLVAALQNIEGVTSANVFENNTSETDGDGIPGHSIWVVVAGTALDADIAQAIYAKRNAGCGMFGTTDYVITQVDGSPFVVTWDNVEEEDLFIEFVATSLNGIDPPDLAGILAGLPDSFVPGVNEQVNINDLATLVQEIDNNTLVTDAGFSDAIGGPYTDTLTPSAKNKKFVITAHNIVITPMILSPVESVVALNADVQFTALGGRSAYTYSISVNNSGGSINASTGLYTAGPAEGTDTIHVVDDLGNLADATVEVQDI